MNGSIRLLAAAGALKAEHIESAISKAVAALCKPGVITTDPDPDTTSAVESVLDAMGEVLDAATAVGLNLAACPDGGDGPSPYIAALQRVDTNIIRVSPQSAFAYYGSVFAAGCGSAIANPNDIARAALTPFQTTFEPVTFALQENCYWCLGNVSWVCCVLRGTWFVRVRVGCWSAGSV